MTDLWIEASRDLEAENAEAQFTLAKMATASLWPFLALAQTDEEFSHRLALAEPQIDAAVPDAVVRDKVLASFRDDFALMIEGAGITLEPNDEVRKSILRRQMNAREEAERNGEDYEDEDAEQAWRREGKREFFHEGLKRWITIEAVENAQPHNPYFDDPTPENGPATGIESYHFPTAAPDPVNPLNSEYPAQPQAWTVPPDKAWVERPMNFAPYQTTAGARVTATPGATIPAGEHSHYTDEGVETGTGPNPDFFSGGTEGATGDPQQSFPADVSLDEPDERVEWYNNTPPQPITAAKDNHGVCAGDGCGRPVYRKGDDWYHLDGQLDHHVLLHSTHPWVQQRLSVRKQAFPFRPGDTVRLTRGHQDSESGVSLPVGHQAVVDHVTDAGPEGERWLALQHPSTGDVVYVPSGLARHAEYKYVHQRGDKWVITQKGTGKVLSEHDSQGDAEASFRAMMMHKHEGARGFHDPNDSTVRAVTADVSSSDMGSGQQSPAADTGGGATPNPPPSMVPGGPGSIAAPPAMPQTIPNASTSTNPFAGGGGGGGGGENINSPNPPMGNQPPTLAALQAWAAEVRERPSIFNPSGVGDEFTERTWDSAARQRPMQNSDERGINTPQKPTEPIPQLSSSDAERQQPQGEDDEEDED